MRFSSFCFHLLFLKPECLVSQVIHYKVNTSKGAHLHIKVEISEAEGLVTFLKLFS